jgi:hypothetical protein
VGYANNGGPAPTSAQEERERIYSVAMPPQKLLDELTLHMSPRGYALESRFESSVTFMRYEEASLAIAFLLVFLFVLPAILYLILAGHDVRTTVTVMEAEGGCRFVLGGDDEQGRYDIRQWAERLPSLPGT